MLLPSGHWKWFIDKQSHFLMIEMDAGLSFQTAYLDSQLKLIPENLYFQIQHSQSFIESLEAINHSNVPFESSVKTQIALNATAAKCFHKPVLNKSWLYTKNAVSLHGDEQQLAWLTSHDESYLMLTLEQQGSSVLCLNLSEEFKTSDNKVHPQFSLINVLSDRLMSLEQLEDDDDQGLENQSHF
ncbi:MAG: cell division protein ZapC domain-containing protein [Aliiglaciecola sp.]|uniref:cell division protein ZapC domain-containing protein n=1 Tax=unclassified Aliiglaciecola TaxID=2593648 RepID=UPI00329757FF